MAEFRCQGPRIALREYRPSDLPAVLRYAADPEVTRYLIWGPEGAREVEAFLARCADEADTDPRRQYEVAAVLKGTGELIGAARIGVLSSEHRQGDIGYVLRRDRWGQGLGSEIAGLLLGYGFAQLGLHRIEATCDPGNAASRRLLENAGMRYEGLRRHDFFVRGIWRDSLLFAKLEDDPPV
jgi:RimJ/RimL family protein N-acetyltransferase